MAFKKATTESKSAGSAPVLEEGSYDARIVQIVDLGLQPLMEGSKSKEPQRKIAFKFELLDEFMVGEDGKPIPEKPRWFEWEISYTSDGYMHEKSMMLKMWKAVGADDETELKDLIGRPLQVLLTRFMRTSGKHKGTESNKVTGAVKMKEKDVANAPALVNPTLFFDLDEPDVDAFKKLPFGNQYCLQEKIKGNLEYNGSKLQALLGEKATDQAETNGGDSSEETPAKTETTTTTPAQDSGTEEDVFQ